MRGDRWLPPDEQLLGQFADLDVASMRGDRWLPPDHHDHVEVVAFDSLQ